MAKKKIKRFPGSIFAHNKKWYIKYKGIRTATGLGATQENYPIAEKILERIYLTDKGVNNNRNIQIRIKDAFEEYINYKSNKMLKTMVMYKYSFNTIVSNNYILDLKSIEIDILKLLQKGNLKKISKADYIRQFLIFINWCYRNKYIEDPRYLRELLPKYKTITKSWTQQEIDAFIDYFCWYDQEIAILIQFMLNTGARMVDALSLKWSDINGNIIIWKNKIDKTDEPRPVSNYVLSLISKIKKNEKVFRWTYNGKGFLNKKLREACQIINIIDNEKNIQDNKDNTKKSKFKKINRNERSFQEFRVTFHLNLIKNGINEIDSKYLLRHSPTDVTGKHYTPIYENEVLEKLNKIGKL
jgi:integrase